MSHIDNETHSPGTEVEQTPVGCVAYYRTHDAARTAVKLLINHGIESSDIYVLCTDEVRQEKFRSELLPAGGAQLETAPSVVSVAGAAMGAGLLGGLGLLTGGIAAAAGAAVGAASGAGVGYMLGAGTYSDDETKRLTDLYSQQLEEGKIAVLVKTEPAMGQRSVESAMGLMVAAGQEEEG